jgi:predicted dienelactone hydrolase
MRIAAVLFVILALSTPARARCTLDDFLASGSFRVGHRRLMLVDGTRDTPAWAGQPALPSRTLPTEVWYPTTATSADAAPIEDAPLASGARHPLVVNSPGLGDAGTGEAYVGIALASRGYVVASPTFPLTNTSFLFDPAGPYLQDVVNQPADVSFLIDQLTTAAAPADFLAGAIDTKRIGVSGLSLGGLNTLLVTYHPTLRDPRVKAAAAMAPASCYLAAPFYDVAKPPLLLLGGDEDLITPLDTNARRTFMLSRSPRRLVTLAHATHTAFSGLIGEGTSPTSYDAVGCLALEGKLTQQQVDDTIAAFGNDPSLVDGTGCALPCVTSPPSTPPMAAGRQHDLSRAAIVAFFESTFRRSKPGSCFLARGLAKEPDVTVARAKGKRLSRRTSRRRS